MKRNWEALKVEERKKKAKSDDAAAAEKRSVLAGVSSAMPSLIEAHKLSSRAAQSGFDWPNIDGLFEKLGEETDELREELKEFPAPGPAPQGRGIAGSGRTVVSRRTAGSTGRGGWGSVLRTGEHSTLSFGRRGVGASQDKSQVQEALSMDGRSVCTNRGERLSRHPWKNSSLCGRRRRSRRSRPVAEEGQRA